MKENPAAMMLHRKASMYEGLADSVACQEDIFPRSSYHQTVKAGITRIAAEVKPYAISDIQGVFLRSRRAPTNTSGKVFAVLGILGVEGAGFGDEGISILTSFCVIFKRIKSDRHLK